MRRGMRQLNKKSPARQASSGGAVCDTVTADQGERIRVRFPAYGCLTKISYYK